VTFTAITGSGVVVKVVKFPGTPSSISRDTFMILALLQFGGHGIGGSSKGTVMLVSFVSFVTLCI
jgi:hypothetical protein